MVVAIQRSKWMVRLVYFLERYSSVSGSRSFPPSKFGDLTWREVYEQFVTKLGDGRSFKTFVGSAEGLRKGNIRANKDRGVNFLPKYEAFLRDWVNRSQTQQWADLQQFRRV